MGSTPIFGIQKGRWVFGNRCWEGFSVQENSSLYPIRTPNVLFLDEFLNRVVILKQVMGTGKRVHDRRVLDVDAHVAV